MNKRLVSTFSLALVISAPLPVLAAMWGGRSIHCRNGELLAAGVGGGVRGGLNAMCSDYPSWHRITADSPPATAFAVLVYFDRDSLTRRSDDHGSTRCGADLGNPPARAG